MKKDKSYASIASVTELKAFLFHHLDFIVMLAILTFAIYANSLRGAFVSDDFAVYVSGEATKSILAALKTLTWYRILSAVNFTLFGISPVALHIVSVTLHLMAVLLFFIFSSMFFSKKVAMFSAVLFAAHPLATEAVSWISGNAYLITAIATFASLICYSIYKKSSKIIWLYVTYGIFVSALVFIRGPHVLVIFPMLLVLDQFLLEKKFNLKSALMLLPLLIPALLYLFTMRSLIEFRLQTVGPNLDQAKTSYLVSLPYSLYMSAKFLIFPWKLTLYHDAEPISQTLLFIMRATAVLILGSVILNYRKHRIVVGLILMALASFAYMLTPIQVAWFFAERYLYIAIGMFAILLSLLLVKIEEKERVRNLALWLVVIITVFYSARTIMRNSDWKTNKSLWESTAKVVPLSARNYNNLGDVYYKEGSIGASINAFKYALKLDPNYADAAHNLGNTYYKIGDLENAEVYMRKALELNPTSDITKQILDAILKQKDRSL